MKRIALFFAALGTGLMARPLRAAMYTLTDNVDATYNNSTEFEPVMLNPHLPTVVVFEIPIYATISNLQPGQTGFGNLDITATITGGQMTFDPLSPFGGSPDIYKSGKAFVSYFSDGYDGVIETSATPTIQEVVVSIDANVTSPSDPRYMMGQIGASYTPVLLGYYYVDCPENAALFGETFNIVVNDQGTNNSGVLTPDPTGTHQNPAAITVFPEPASLSIVGMGALDFILGRRRPKRRVLNSGVLRHT